MACVFDDPRHANGGCVFADPAEILVPARRGGGHGEDHIRNMLELDDEHVIVAVIRKFLEVVNGNP